MTKHIMKPDVIYTNIVSKIIKNQEVVIGPLAVERAKKVGGLSVKSDSDISFTGDSKKILEALVAEYEALFGKASVEVCRDAVREISPPVPADMLPKNLQ